MMRTFLISLLITTFIVCVQQVSHADNYLCETIPGQTSICSVGNYNSTNNTIVFSCHPAGSASPVEISCGTIYSALLGESSGYNWTGVRGFNWVCGKDMVVPDSDFQNRKLMCDKLCGTCAVGWQ